MGGRAAQVFTAALGLLLASTALAEDHALILWIGQYADPRVRLVGADQDAVLARNMALAMGVPAANIMERSNGQLTHAGFKQALALLGQRVREGDSVMIYFSGHGRQLPRISGAPGCSEGIATYEGGIYFDLLLRTELDALASRASRVVMFNDSCFAGGAATKQIPVYPPKAYPSWATDAKPDGPDTFVAKGSLNTGEGGSTPHACGAPVNWVGKSLAGVAQQAPTQRVLYLAGAAANEAAYPTPQGSVATRAWAACLADPTARNGASITGQTLAVCAQNWVQRNSPYKQTITLVGNGQLPLRRF